MWNSKLPLWIWAVSLSLGCTSIAGLNDFEIVAGGGAGTGGTAGGGGSTGGGGSGGDAACTHPDECPGTDQICSQRTCDQGSCGMQHASVNTPCTEDGGDVCDGAGSCVLSTGQPCDGSTPCLSGSCVDGYCCDAPCGGTCEACSTPGSEGTCTRHGLNTDPETECPANQLCDGLGECKKIDSIGCGAAAECLSGFCVDLMCCNTACAGTCEACDVVAGVCSQHAPGSDPDSDCTGPPVGVCDGAGSCAAGGHLWSYRYGNNADQSATDVAVDSAGNVIVTGFIAGPTDFGGGVLTPNGEDIFVAKLTAGGGYLWAVHFSAAADQRALAVAVDGSDNIIITGHYEGSMDFGTGLLSNGGNLSLFLTKLNAAGTVLWSNDFYETNAEQVGTDVATDAAGNVLVTGYYKGIIDLSSPTVTAGALPDAGGKKAVFAAKFDPNGTHQWSSAYGDAAQDQVSSGVAIDSAGNVVLTGSFMSTIDFGCGSLSSADSGRNDVFVAKLDNGGSCLWADGYGSAAADQYGEGVAVDPSDSIVITGSFRASIDFGGGPLSSADATKDDVFAAKLDPAGNHSWSHGYGSAADHQRGTAVAVDSAGNVVLTGYFRASIDFGGGPLNALAAKNAVYLAKLAADSSHLWSYRFGNSGQDQLPQAVAVAADGSVLLVGDLLGIVDYGGGPLTSAGGADALVVKYSP